MNSVEEVISLSIESESIDPVTDIKDFQYFSSDSDHFKLTINIVG